MAIHWAGISASDELYVGSVFRPGVTFGRGVGEIQRFFANDHFEPLSSNSNNGRHDTAGWTKLYDGSADGTVGRIVYLQQGETMTRMFAHECLSTGL